MEVRLVVIAGGTLVPDERNILDPNHEASATSKRQHDGGRKKHKVVVVIIAERFTYSF